MPAPTAEDQEKDKSIVKEINALLAANKTGHYVGNREFEQQFYVLKHAVDLDAKDWKVKRHAYDKFNDYNANRLKLESELDARIAAVEKSLSGKLPSKCRKFYNNQFVELKSARSESNELKRYKLKQHSVLCAKSSEEESESDEDTNEVDDLFWWWPFGDNTSEEKKKKRRRKKQQSHGCHQSCCDPRREAQYKRYAFGSGKGHFQNNEEYISKKTYLRNMYSAQYCGNAANYGLLDNFLKYNYVRFKLEESIEVSSFKCYAICCDPRREALYKRVAFGRGRGYVRKNQEYQQKKQYLRINHWRGYCENVGNYGLVDNFLMYNHVRLKLEGCIESRIGKFENEINISNHVECIKFYLNQKEALRSALNASNSQKRQVLKQNNRKCPHQGE
ncbi:CG31680, partial [Drosophila busckii]